MLSIWNNSVDFPKFNSLNCDKTADVLVIGGGICGLLTAYFLKKNGVDCVVLEAEKIASGTTMNTTAKITSQHGLIFADMVKRFGNEKTALYLKANESAINKYKELSKKYPCDFEIKPSVVYSTNERQKLEMEAEALLKVGFKSRLLNKLPLPIKTVGGIEFHNQAQFNPIMFLNGIVKDLNVYEKSRVLKIEGNTAICKNGSIKAEKIIVTTHFPFIDKYGLYFLKMYQSRSYVLGLQNAPNFDGMYVDENDSGLSFRNYGDYLLLGGYGHRTGKGDCGFNSLEKFALKKFPESKIKYRFAAQDCKTLDDIPYIGRYSNLKDNLYVATGFNKWGMTLSMVAAEILCDMVLGRDNEYSEIFSPSRSIFRKQLLINSGEAVSGLIGFSKKRCTHLGCKLKWNSYEKSWDCGCHGSRFSENGKIIDGPANIENR